MPWPLRMLSGEPTAVAAAAGAGGERSDRSETLSRIVTVDRRRFLRLTLLLALSSCLLLAALLAGYYRFESGNRTALLLSARERNLQLAALALTDAMGSVMSDLRYCASVEPLRAYLENGAAVARTSAGNALVTFMREKRHYDQMRLIAPDGMEHIRINRQGENARLVPAAELQSKAGRYYMRALASLGRDEIYVSPMDLNVEHGRIEQPQKVVVRVGMALFDGDGRRLGYLLFNVLGDDLLQGVRRLASEQAPIWLTDAGGDLLLGPRPGWGDAGAFSRLWPDAWSAIQHQASGAIDMAGWRLNFLRVYPLKSPPWHTGKAGSPRPGAAERYHWTLVSLTSAAELAALNAGLWRNTLVSGSWLALLATALAAALAFAMARSRALAKALEKVVDNVPMLVSYVDAQQRYRFNNMAYLSILGQSPRRIYGRHLREVLGEQAYLQVLPHVTKVLGGQRVDFESQVHYAGTGPRDVVVAYVPDIAANGEVRGFYAVVNDVTQLKEAQRRERQHLLELAHVSRLASVGEVATELAHQINQPLSAIGMFSAAIGRQLDRPEDRARALEWLEMIKAQVRRASEVVQRLRRFAHRGASQWLAVDLNQSLREVVALLEHEIRARQVRLTLDLTEPLPPVRADPLLLEQVIYNLLRNALEAVSKLEHDAEIILRTHANADVWLEVLDNGPGLDEALGEGIFDPFMAHHQSDGLGVGLAVSRSIVQAHAGALSYAARPQGGTVFQLHLPVMNR